MKRGTGTAERNENSRHATLCCCDVAREPYRESAMAIYLFAKRIQFAHQDIFHAAFVSCAYVYMYACVYACVRVAYTRIYPQAKLHRQFFFLRCSKSSTIANAILHKTPSASLSV